MENANQANINQDNPVQGNEPNGNQTQINQTMDGVAQQESNKIGIMIYVLFILLCHFFYHLFPTWNMNQIFGK